MTAGGWRLAAEEASSTSGTPPLGRRLKQRKRGRKADNLPNTDNIPKPNPKELSKVSHYCSNAEVTVCYLNAMAQKSLNNLITLYEAWNKPEKAEEWRTKLAQIEDFQK
jgi:hypothetical protein